MHGCKCMRTYMDAWMHASVHDAITVSLAPDAIQISNFVANHVIIVIYSKPSPS